MIIIKANKKFESVIITVHVTNWRSRDIIMNENDHSSKSVLFKFNLKIKLKLNRDKNLDLDDDTS